MLKTSLNTRNALATFDVNGWGGRIRTWGRKKNEKYVEEPFIIMKINEKIVQNSRYINAIKARVGVEEEGAAAASSGSYTISILDMLSLPSLSQISTYYVHICVTAFSYVVQRSFVCWRPLSQNESYLQPRPF